MRFLSVPLFALVAFGTPCQAQTAQDVGSVTILRGASAPPPPPAPAVVQQTIIEPRTIVEYRYLTYPVVFYVPVHRTSAQHHR